MTHLRDETGFVASDSHWHPRIPKTWTITRLRYVAKYRNSNVDKKSYPGQQEVQLCNYTDVYYSEFLRPCMNFMTATATAREIENFELKAGDVIITKDSEDPADIGIPALVTEDMPGVICGYHLTVIRTGSMVTARFLHRLLQSHLARTYFFVEAPGVTRYGLNQEAIGNVPIALPSTSEMGAIADLLDRETTRIDTLIEKKTRFIELLKEKGAAVITHAVTKGLDPDAPTQDSGAEWLGEIPAHWQILRIAALFREVNRPPDPQMPVLSVSIHDGVTDGELTDEDRDRRVVLSEDRTKYQGVAPGDLVYNMMRAWQGSFGAVAVDGLVSPAYVVAAPIGEVRTKFIEHLLRTKNAIEEVRRYSRGVADFRMRLYWDYFRNVRICLPPLAEQDRILKDIEGGTARINGLISLTERSIELLKEKRSALITAAVTGKIDVREAA